MKGRDLRPLHSSNLRLEHYGTKVETGKEMERDRTGAATKVVGRVAVSHGPIEYHRRALQLWRRIQRLNPHPRPRGFVFKAPSRERYEEWRRAQLNPRLW